MGMGIQVRWAALAISCVALVGGCASAPAGRAASTDQVAPTGGGPARTSSGPVRTAAGGPVAEQEPTVHSSPFAPPFGYCGGLHSVADTGYIVNSGFAVAFVRTTVSARGRPEAGGDTAGRVSHTTLLAGKLPGGRPTRVETPDLRPGRYLLLLGYHGAYYVAAGLYGSFRREGRHAYRLCYDFHDPHQQLVRTGVTTVSGLTRLFARGLRRRR
jgi:hypothetical protein